MALSRVGGLARSLLVGVALKRTMVAAVPDGRRDDCESRPAPAAVVQIWRSYGKQAKKAKSEDVTVPTITVDTLRPFVKDFATTQMEAAVDALSRELNKLRTGRAGPGMLDHVLVEANGMKSPLSHVAAVSVSNPQTLSVMPYDPSMVKAVESGILSSPLRLNPLVEGQILTVPVPKLTKEHYNTMCKMVTRAGESAKLSLRRARKDALEKLTAVKSDIAKDDMKRLEKEVEELTKKFSKTVEEMCDKKQKEISVG